MLGGPEWRERRDSEKPSSYSPGKEYPEKIGRNFLNQFEGLEVDGVADDAEDKDVGTEEEETAAVKEEEMEPDAVHFGNRKPT